MVGNLIVHVESMSASISDNSQAAMDNGVPNGWVDGDVSCTGDMEVDSRNFNNFNEIARGAGGWRAIRPFDIIAMGVSGDERQKMELFGCKITVSDLFGTDSKGGEKTKHKLTFSVTDPAFVRINGVPYLTPRDTRYL